ncbi:hypothetical protein HSX37_18575|uniref:AP2-like DNA-binding integrase domain-containing protein n=1 Tax=Dendrosporobacter quercicolus TaxID=146817 RepID=A0A1H0A965_9FIRM|nr:hypothetical protein [Dendrosporobacter quercicolus]NSL50022.1 hypothetical protein [Dendrosporobacter quercicolus DSM 1736]SDN30015.1 hypothetical protein SAMN04488502_1176 [Dendrosporobacter quercicolus]
MKTGNYGKGSIYRRQDGRRVAAVCSRAPATGKTIRHYAYGPTKQEALQKKMELLAKNKELPAPSGLTAKHS